LKHFEYDQPGRAERKVERRTQTFDAVRHFFHSIMQPSDAVLRHFSGFIADLLVHLLLAQFSTAHPAEQFGDLCPQLLHACAHGSQDVFQVMADVAEQRDHFGFLGVLELLGLLNRQRGKGEMIVRSPRSWFVSGPARLFRTFRTPIGSPRQRRSGTVIMFRVTNPVV